MVSAAAIGPISWDVIYGIVVAAIEAIGASLPWAIAITAFVLLITLVLNLSSHLNQSKSADKEEDDTKAETGLEGKAKEGETDDSQANEGGGIKKNNNTDSNSPDDDPFNENDAEVLSKLTRKELKEKLPDDWDYQEHNGRVHIRDSNGKMRIRIDEPETKPPARTPYRHMHIYDENGNPLDVDGNIVDKYDPSGHIPYSD